MTAGTPACVNAAPSYVILVDALAALVSAGLELHPRPRRRFFSGDLEQKRNWIVSASITEPQALRLAAATFASEMPHGPALNCSADVRGISPASGAARGAP